jgi:hypothetical protein
MELDTPDEKGGFAGLKSVRSPYSGHEGQTSARALANAEGVEELGDYRPALAQSVTLVATESQQVQEETEFQKLKVDTGFCRIMSFYSPKIFALFSVIVSMANSLAFPMFGYIFSRLMFVLI